MKCIVIIVILLVSTINFCWGQQNTFTRNPDAKVFREVSEQGWVKFQNDLNVSPESLFQVHLRSFGLGKLDEMRLVKIKKDEFGYTHARFQQYHNKVKVFGGEFLIHAKNDTTFSGNGKIYTAEKIINSITISESTALQIALNHIRASGYYWQDFTREKRLKQKTKNLNATYFPKADMEYIIDVNNSRLILCYSFAIYTEEVGKSARIYIDATNGKLIKRLPLEMNCDFTSVNTNWYLTRGIFTNNVGIIGNSFDLEDDCTSSVYSVYDATNNNNLFNTPNNVWASDWQRSAATSLWCVKETFNWFRGIFGRPGHDDEEGDLDIFQGFNFPGGNNASYIYDQFGDDEIRIGVGNTISVQDDYNALDIIAHEFTHGITRYEANLVYEKEPGALNESFSDIFGEWVENNVFGTNNWFLGWDRIEGTCNDPIRYLVNPAAQNVAIGGTCTLSFSQPNCYQGSNWVNVVGCIPGSATNPPDNDHCGVHTNSGVQNQMFYLLVEGGNGWNNGQTCHAPPNSGFQWNVTGIGIDKAAQIAYKALTSYLTSQSGYIDARNAWVQAAVNIFGACSFEAIQTGRAWAAVGIGPPIPATVVLCNEVYGVFGSFNLETPNSIVTNENCTVNIFPTGNLVRFISGERIALKNGFTALAGSQFIARVNNDCRYAAY